MGIASVFIKDCLRRIKDRLRLVTNCWPWELLKMAAKLETVAHNNIVSNFGKIAETIDDNFCCGRMVNLPCTVELTYFKKTGNWFEEQLIASCTNTTYWEWRKHMETNGWSDAVYSSPGTAQVMSVGLLAFLSTCWSFHKKNIPFQVWDILSLSMHDWFRDASFKNSRHLWENSIKDLMFGSLPLVLFTISGIVVFYLIPNHQTAWLAISV